MKRETLVAFDFDGTITRSDTLLRFIGFSKGNANLYLGFLLFTPLFIAMKLNMYSNGKAKEKFFSYFFKGMQVEKFNSWCKAFSALIDKALRQDTLNALNIHKEHKDKILIISASIENWIQPWADKTGVDMVLATKIEIDEKGLLTGRFLTENCNGEEKVNRLLAAFPDRSTYRLVVYGDSRGDKPLMDFADESIVV